MNRNVVTVLIVVVILALAGGAYFLTKSSDSKKDSTTTDTQTSSMQHSTSMSESKTNDATNMNATATNTVTIENFAFSPASITVKKGTTVTWTNKDSAVHDVTETDGQTGPKSERLETGKSYSFTFDTVGTFKYDCSIHPDMTGMVTVTE